MSIYLSTVPTTTQNTDTCTCIFKFLHVHTSLTVYKDPLVSEIQVQDQFNSLDGYLITRFIVDKNISDTVSIHL